MERYDEANKGTKKLGIQSERRIMAGEAKEEARETRGAQSEGEAGKDCARVGKKGRLDASRGTGEEKVEGGRRVSLEMASRKWRNVWKGGTRTAATPV